jgi:phosphoheptose isomerase
MEMNYTSYIRDCIRESNIEIKNELLFRIDDIWKIADKIAKCYQNKNKLLVFRNDNPLEVIALTTDYNFTRQAEIPAEKNDILLGISTSGKSKNITEAFQKGKKIGTYNISLTGCCSWELRELSDICFNVPSIKTQRIQEANELIYNIVCDLVKQKLFGGEK